MVHWISHLGGLDFVNNKLPTLIKNVVNFINIQAQRLTEVIKPS